MQDPNISELLEKYNAGTITGEELVLLESWYLQWQPESLEVSQEELLAAKEEVWNAIGTTGKVVRSRSWQAIAVAASFLLLLSAASYYLWRHPAKDHAPLRVVAINPTPEVKPGGNKALLILSNGRQISLTDAENGKVADQGTIAVNKPANGQLVYGATSAGSTSDEMIYNTLSTPRGGQYHLILSDGTKVWLNAASSITYPVAFTRGERKVVVQGEVYFEVAQNEQLPFRVSTGNQEVIVLGTHFNVNGYADDAAISTTLLAGSVRIRNIISGQSSLLAPGQQSRILKNDAAISIKKVNPEDAISWKNGYFLFDNQDIKTIMKMMSRWYDVDIEYNNYNSQERFGGTFSRSSDMSEILRNLEQLGHVRFRVQGRKITITN